MRRRRPNPATQFVLRVEQRDRAHDVVPEAVDRGGVLLVVRPAVAQRLEEARLSLVSRPRSNYLDVSVWFADVIAGVSGSLARDGSARWRYAREARKPAALEPPVEEFLERYGAYVDALLALYFQRLRTGEYTLAEFP